MLNFECDYNNGCLTEILQALSRSNADLQTGYGNDAYTLSAKERIRAATGCMDADIYFLAGGTQTNMTVISSVLRGYEGVIAAETGHIGTHEAGAIEASGHKVLPLRQTLGKISAEDLETYLKNYYADGNYDHMVFPGMVYISFPTELGTLYTKAELQAIHSVCGSYNIPLYIDGARLGYGLMSRECDISLKEFASLCDIFYIGGTKVGALCGEALVFPRNNAPEHFFTSVKKCGALLAKGRLCGVQFDTLFTDGLYLKAAENAIVTAELLKAALKEKGYRFYLETGTNQQFVIIENSRMAELSKKVKFSFWDRYDENHTVIRFCTSWFTTPESIEELKAVL